MAHPLRSAHDLAEGDARGIVDADMDELPADAAAVALAGAVAGDAVADPIELAELFDVDVDQLARPLALISARRLGRLQGAQLVEAQTLEDAADGGRRDAGFGGDRLAGQALAAQRFRCGRSWPAASADAAAAAASCDPAGRPGLPLDSARPICAPCEGKRLRLH